MTQHTRQQNHWPIFLRIIAAIFGGYALATAAGILLSYILPMSRSDAVMTSLLASFAIYTAAVLWVFSVRSLHAAWLGLVLPTMVLATVSGVLKFSGVML